MFGIIIAGRLVQTDMQQVSENQFLFNVPDADNINHIVVFMTGTQPFPDGMGAAVYFCWPNPTGANWNLLGYLANAKPSAIFKVASLKEGPTDTVHPFGQFGSSHTAQIGISVEPLTQLAQQTPAPNTAPTNVPAFAEFSQKMVENLYNFASSFALTPAQMSPANAADTFVPLSTLQKWFANFTRRLEQNPNFWKS